MVNLLYFNLRSSLNTLAMTLLLGLLSATAPNSSAASGEEFLSLEIAGGKSDLQDNIRAHLDLNTVSCIVSDLRLRSRLRGSDAKIANALHALGYYHASWTLNREFLAERKNGLNDSITTLPGKLLKRKNNVDDKGCWRLLLTLTQGPLTYIRNMDIVIAGAGSQDEAFQSYLRKLPIATGDPLRHELYDKVKYSISQLARNAGYLDGKFEKHSLAVDIDSQAADIILHFNSGPRYLFGEIHFAPSLIDESLLKRYVPFSTGEPFESSKLIQLQSNLVSSNYFSSVNIEQQNQENTVTADSATANGSETSSPVVDIEVSTTEKLQYQTTTGIGASTDTGPRISYGLNNRRVNSDGDTYLIAAQYSPVDSNLSYQYTQLGEQPLSDKIQWSTGVQLKDTDTAKSTSYRAEVALISLQSNSWIQTLSLKFLRENYEIANERNTSTLLMPGIAWSRSEANDHRYPTRGWRINVAARGALKGVASDISLGQAELDGKLIVPFLGGRLISRSGLGLTALNDFAELPASLRFFAGGDNSVRGFRYESLGPENEVGEVVGGKHRLTGSVEYDHRVWSDFALATFYDAGNAFDTKDYTLYQSAGVGLRWLSPIGPIRVDFAFPLKDGGFHFHLSMGPDL